MADYSTVSIRKALHEEIERVISDQRLGYSSVAEFTKEAIRLHLHGIVKLNIRLIIENRIKSRIYRQRFEDLFME